MASLQLKINLPTLPAKKSTHRNTKNAEALVVATKEIGLEVNADKTKYMIMSRDQNAG